MRLSMSSSSAALPSSSGSCTLLRAVCHALLLLPSLVGAQNAYPSGMRTETPPSGSLQYILQSQQFATNPILLLGLVESMARPPSQNFTIHGVLKSVNRENINQLGGSDIVMVSCDEFAQPNNLKVKDTLKTIMTRSPTPAAMILYSMQLDRCQYKADDALPAYPNIFTITRVTTSQAVQRKLEASSGGTSSIEVSQPSTVINGDLEHKDPSRPIEKSTQNSSSTPSTSVAMIILYSVTGVVTLLFLSVIVTGAIRAHRHPERYGPRDAVGRPRQSRAKGIARAMLETLPIVKFGDLDDHPAGQQRGDGKTKRGDEEMGDAQHPEMAAKERPSEDSSAFSVKNVEHQAASTEQANVGAPASRAASPEAGPAGAATATATATADAALGCPICTEDFEKGQDVRLLPCDHKFHPECIDPWLVNVSGTCPLCRIDLHPPSEDEEEDGYYDDDGHFHPRELDPNDANHNHNHNNNDAAVAAAEGDGEPAPAPRTSGDSSTTTAPDQPAAPRRAARRARPRRRSLATYIQSTINAIPLSDATLEERLDAVRRLRTAHNNNTNSQTGDNNNASAAGAIGPSSSSADHNNRRSRRFSQMLIGFRVRTRRHGEEA
ncbi:hypothetical protein LOZ53_006796 [Ophidiomyces ophidiicola]|nr:hypothetical protein LOZ55_006768 [Ophidiomyces ophidiicola]KAI1979064.1 hypothetical protein LOZ53_006796 [Ophidiomyces ophidiicola]KAI1987703.1 hypothetical protein LOZ54_003446 [Ophidiomyces ophidiicola]KAI2003223.1 hypothetical protein LOZ51_000297 [Ophidiomyces ophidiicola]